MTTPGLLTLVVCTRNRAALLERTLPALLALDGGGPWELVVVNSACTDRTDEVIAQASRGAPVPVRRVHEPRPGLGRARNAGVAGSSSELLVMTDDDCAPAPDFLSRHRAAFEDPAVGFVGGRITSPAGAVRDHDCGGVPVRLPPRSFVPVGLLQGGNFAFRRRAWTEAGRFDDDFGSGTPFPAEDCEFAARVSFAGWSVIYAPEIVVHHAPNETVLQRKRAMRNYDRGRGAYFAKLVLQRPSREVYLREWARSLGRTTLRWPPSTVRQLQGAAGYASLALRRWLSGNGDEG